MKFLVFEVCKMVISIEPKDAVLCKNGGFPRKPNHQPPLSPGCLIHSHYVAGSGSRSVTEMDGCEWKDKMMSCNGSVTFKDLLGRICQYDGQFEWV